MNGKMNEVVADQKEAAMRRRSPSLNTSQQSIVPLANIKDFAKAKKF
jgi:hypothetical protein